MTPASIDRYLTLGAVLPSQFLPPKSLSPCQALLLAVLEQAVADYLGDNRRLRLDAESYVWGASQDGPCAFETVCSVLDLDPAAVRDALRRATQSAAPRSRDATMRRYRT